MEFVGKTDSAFAESKEHTLVLKMEDVNKKRQHDLDDAGIAKTAREEKIPARDQKAKDAEMMKLYREHVLGEKPVEGVRAPRRDPTGRAEAGGEERRSRLVWRLASNDKGRRDRDKGPGAKASGLFTFMRKIG